MAKYRIVTPMGASSPMMSEGYDYEMEGLGDIDAEIVECPATTEGFIEAARDADAIYAKALRFTKAMIDTLPEKCRGLVAGGVGVDNIDVVAATMRGIPVTNCPDVFIEEVADHAMALLLAGHRRLIEQDRMVREGRWRDGRPQLLQIPRLMGSTLGLIAFGRVARQTALRAKPFGLHVLAYDPFIDETRMREYGVEPSTLEDLLRNSDFISMHVPGRPETNGLLQEKHFRLMKKTAWFINTGRGATVDEAALIRALQEKWIAGASLDVLEVEPPRQDNPLLQMQHIILSPHNASASARFDPARRRRVGSELALLLKGLWPMSCVNPSVLERSNLRRWQPYSMDRGPNS